MSLSLVARRARLVSIRDQIDAHGPGALLLFTDSAMPASPEAVIGVTPSATVALAASSFDVHPTDASMYCEATGNALVSGVVTWGLFVDALGVGVLLCTAGGPGSGAQLLVIDESTPPADRIWTGGVVTVECTLTEA